MWSGDDNTVYNDSRQLLEYLFTEHPQVNLLILDIEIPELDGLELKKQITSIYMDANILFLTDHREMMGNAFGRNVIGFLLKEHFEERHPLFRMVWAQMYIPVLPSLEL